MEDLDSEMENNGACETIVIIMMKLRRMRMAEKRKTCSLLVGMTEAKKPLVRQRYMWASNIKMDLREIDRSVVDWNSSAQDRDK